MNRMQDELQQRLEQVQDLLEQRKTIDEKLAELMGVSASSRKVRGGGYQGTQKARPA